MNKAVDSYRLAVIIATCKELESGLEILAKDVSRRKGSWMTRTLGIRDALKMVASYRKEIEKRVEA